jgi:hypothetical protein
VLENICEEHRRLFQVGAKHFFQLIACALLEDTFLHHGDDRHREKCLLNSHSLGFLRQCLFCHNLATCRSRSFATSSKCASIACILLENVQNNSQIRLYSNAVSHFGRLATFWLTKVIAYFACLSRSSATSSSRAMVTLVGVPIYRLMSLPCTCRAK